MRGKTVPQHVRTHALFDARVLRRIVADVPDRFVGQVLAFGSWLTGKEPRFRLLPAPVLTQRFEEPGTERYVAVFSAFALVNMNDHALAVDVLNAQAN